MISKKQGTLVECLGQLHSDLLEISDFISQAKTSHDFLKYVFSNLVTELSGDADTTRLIEHLITTFIAENECYLNELEVLSKKARSNTVKIKSL